MLISPSISRVEPKIETNFENAGIGSPEKEP